MEVLNKILLASKSDSLGIPSPFVRSPGWEAWHGVPNLLNSGRTSLVLLLSSLWVGLDEAQARNKIARRTNNNLRYADDTTLMA